ncbi:hypothetical protein ABFV05_019948 [Capra hircus]
MGLEKLGNLMGLFLVDEVAEGRKHDANNRLCLTSSPRPSQKICKIPSGKTLGVLGRERRGLLVGIKTGLNEFQKAGFSNPWTPICRRRQFQKTN